MIENENIYIRISPEVLSTDIVPETLSGNTFGVYSGMSEILSGGTNGDSILTGLTIPILLTETFNDLGYYSPFDGLALQYNVITNFLFSAETANKYNITLYNTSDEFFGVNQFSTYQVDWGDNSAVDTMSLSSITHNYQNISGSYDIKLTQTNPFGTINIVKPITLPLTGVTIDNLNGNITFSSDGGNWSGTSSNYNYIFSGDSSNTVADQVTSHFITVPYIVSGFTKSMLTNLKNYGKTPYDPAVTIYKENEEYGRVLTIDPTYTSYTINGITYYDYPNGRTLFIFESSGFTENDLVAVPLTKEENLLDVAMQPEIQSQIFIERGKNSAFEGLQRLGEVDNIGDLVRYGYGFYKINEQ